MDYLPDANSPTKQKSKGIVNKVKNKVKKKMKGKGNDFDKSENSMFSQGTADTDATEQRRGRGRSLGLKPRRNNHHDATGNDPRSQRSRSWSHSGPVDGGGPDAPRDSDRLDERRDRRVRQRSRSIVRDARSLIDMIDGNGDGDSPRGTTSGNREEGTATEESIEGQASIVHAGGRARGFMQKDKSKNPEKKIKLLQE